MKKSKIKYQTLKIHIKKINIFKFLVCVFYFLFLFFNFSEAAASVLSGNELVENAKLHDGQTVEFQGEVIGDIMARGKFAWLNVNDGTRAIGIWAKKDQTKNIIYSGDYNHIGDTIKVLGSFHRACPEHGGDLDIHAQEISLMKEGHKVEHPVDPWKVTFSIILFIATLALYLIFEIKRRFFKA
ncbi:MAG: DNA-binding protein [Candidatus Margulisiibacteriota bacterium]